ncbi:hypothetical protein [Modestobacter sp. VKM Ac-2984]|uniref:hypothetical protein n=1 Tax=Modestobacter sp. VKM Ac-2984 TaxID=3004138 RepID=UPI0022AAA4A5|nr:hypothetical protein [Modestobacter sp. VKM Ac-2984]MCZ2817266.1 hypothetical protein [Modestobacter sp. VKM Ac-2984]
MNDRATLPPAAGGEPYAPLEPLVATLLRRGANLTRPGQPNTPFGPSPEGYIAVLDQRIDWDYVQSHFVIPPFIRYDAARDAIFDDANWTAVYGSSGRLAAR